MATPGQKMRFARLDETLREHLCQWASETDPQAIEVVALLVGTAVRGLLEADKTPDEIREMLETLLMATIGTIAADVAETINTRAPDATAGGN